MRELIKDQMDSRMECEGLTSMMVVGIVTMHDNDLQATPLGGS